MSAADDEKVKRLIAFRQLFGASFHDGLTDVQLDARTAFVCWNILATLSDMLSDIRVSIGQQPFSVELLVRQMQFQDHRAEEMLEFVITRINPRKEGS